jgi:hypothetical protein
MELEQAVSILKEGPENLKKYLIRPVAKRPAPEKRQLWATSATCGMPTKWAATKPCHTIGKTWQVHCTLERERVWRE